MPPHCIRTGGSSSLRTPTPPRRYRSTGSYTPDISPRLLRPAASTSKPGPPGHRLVGRWFRRGKQSDPLETLSSSTAPKASLRTSPPTGGVIQPVVGGSRWLHERRPHPDAVEVDGGATAGPADASPREAGFVRCQTRCCQCSPGEQPSGA